MTSRHFLFLFMASCWLLAPSQQLPIIHLRTAVIRTELEVSRASPRRRSALEVEHHTDSLHWGKLKNTAQFIVAHQTNLTHVGKAALAQQLREHGFDVAGYIPDSSMLVVGPAQLVDEVQAWPGVVWVGEHLPEYKVAPEWEEVLQQLKSLPSNVTFDGGVLQQQQQQLWRAAEAVLQRLPCLVEWGPEGQPRLGVHVTLPRRDRDLQQERGQQGSRHSLLEEQWDGGLAAAADWPGPLRGLCSEGVEVRPAGRNAAVVLAPPRCLEAVLDWLAARPAVHWLAPFPKLRLGNYQASTIVQSGRAAPTPWVGDLATNPAYHRLWAAGITGTGQIIGCGDSGVDQRHCYFRDPNVPDSTWKSKFKYQDGVKTLDCPDCRKIRYYRAFGDDSDSNGHGTHVAGTLVGMPYSASAITSPGTQFQGMAPTARLAFIDLGDGTSDSIYTPADLERGYFDYTYGVGARIHSDSWGSPSTNYDFLAAQVDEYCWRNKDFLPVFAAGNEGDVLNRAGESGTTTVTSPATSKNCICAGATQSSGESLAVGAVKYVTMEATVTQGSTYQSQFRVLQAGFGTPVSTLKGSLRLVAASPLGACAPLQNLDDIKGAVVLIQRGDCNFVQKAFYAQQAGAAAALVFDNMMGAYFVLGTDQSATITIPTMSITRRLGQQLYDALSIGKAMTIAFSPSNPYPNAFDNLATYSSQGPTKDNRIKPDLVAPGTVRSARALALGGGDCDTMLMAGTSMATPVIAGSAALVRQYFVDGYYPSGVKNQADSFTPSAALIKAVMISGASSIEGVEADTGLPIDPPPSFRQGFGRVNLGRSVYLQDGVEGGPRLAVADAVNIKGGESHEYCVRAKGGGLAITLVWTDYPGSPAARKALVNDLDLTVRAEGYNGMPLLGNGGSVTDSSSPDRENNVEQVSLDGLPEGRVSIEVRAFSLYAPAGAQPYALVVTGDFQGNLTRLGGEGGGSCTIVVAVIKSGPTGVTNKDISFEFGTQSGNSKGVSFECALTDPQGNVTAGNPGMHSWQDCTSPRSYPKTLPDGAYQFSVRAKGEKIASSQSFIRDTSPPVVAFARPLPGPNQAYTINPQGTTTSDTAVLSFSGDDTSPVAFKCKLVASGASALQKSVYSGAVNSSPMNLTQEYNCTSPQTFHWLLPAQWQFSVVGTDVAGNSAPEIVNSWAVAFEGGKQYTRLSSGLFGLVPGVPAQFDFGVLQLSGSSLQQVAGAATECWLESMSGSAAAAKWESCTSPKSYGTLADGKYRFHARVVAPASTPAGADTDAVSEFTIDSTAPVSTIVEKPNALHTSDVAMLKFDSNEEGSTFQCRLVNEDDPAVGNKDFQPCQSPKQYANLTDGLYNFSVFAIDLVGNQGGPSAASFVVDTTPPRWTSIMYPVATRDSNITITFMADDGPRSKVQNITCRFRPLALVNSTVSAIDSNWTKCSSPLTYNGLKEGHYGLTLRATDAAGLVNQTQELDIWIDKTPPVVSFKQGPSKTAKSGSKVTFILEEATSLPPGTASNISTYATLLQSIDQAKFAGINNGSITTLTPSASSSPGGNKLASWTGSSSGSSSGGGGSATGQAATGRLLAEGGAAGTALSSSSVGVWTNASSPLTYTGLGSGYYALQVRATDLAGNTGPDSTPYAFQVDASGGGPSKTVWIIVGVAGGVALLAGSTLLFCWWRKRSPASTPGPAPHQQRPTNGYHHPSSYPTANGYPAANGHAANGIAYPAANGYAANGNGYPANGAAGAWGYGGGGYYNYSNGGAPAVPDPIHQQQLALAAYQRPAAAQQPAAPLPVDERALEEQQLAYALAASRRETRGRPEGVDDDMARAIQASLQEQNGWTQLSPAPAAARDEDAELRAALEASLREQQKFAEMSPWGTARR